MFAFVVLGLVALGRWRGSSLSVKAEALLAMLAVAGIAYLAWNVGLYILD